MRFIILIAYTPYTKAYFIHSLKFLALLAIN